MEIIELKLFMITFLLLMKAIKLINQAENEKNADLTKTETVKACWKVYIPAMVTGTASIVCLIGASSVNAKRNAALAAAYTLSDTAFREYKEKVITIVDPLEAARRK